MVVLIERKEREVVARKRKKRKPTTPFGPSLSCQIKLEMSPSYSD